MSPYPDRWTGDGWVLVGGRKKPDKPPGKPPPPPGEKLLPANAGAYSLTGTAASIHVGAEQPSLDLVTDYGAVADAQFYTAAVLTIGAGSKNLSCSTPIFTGSGMAVGKQIRVGYSLTSPQVGGALVTTIAAITDSTHIVLTDAYSYALAAVPSFIAWGTDNSFAINDFNSANAGASDVVLTAPAGSFLFSPGGVTFGAGVRSMTFTGAGAGSTNIIGAIQYGGLGGIQQAGNAAARVLDVIPGATTATLMTAGDASRFTGLTPCWGMLGSVDMQGVTSDPPNNAIWDYVKILSVVGTLVTFDRAVANTHKSTYPLYDPGVGALGSGASCKGGPATLYILYPSWDIDATFQNFSIVTDPNRSPNANGRIIAFNNVTGPHACPQVSVQMQVTMNNCSFPNVDTAAEIDKEVDAAIITNCTFGASVFMQSSSPKNLLITGSTMKALSGGGINIVSSGNTFTQSIAVGVSGYGASNSWSSTNDIIPQIAPGGCFIPDVSIYTLQDGIISFPLTSDPVRWAVPGARVFFSGLQNNEDNMFIVTDLSTDGNAVYATLSIASGNTVLTSTTSLWQASDQGKPIRISTSGGFALTTTIATYTSPTQITLAAPAPSALTSAANTYVIWGHARIHTDRLGNSWPSLPTGGGGLLSLQAAPVNRATFVNCTGCQDALDLSRAPANSALYSYSNRTYDATGDLNWGSGVTGPQPSFNLWGAFTSVKITVSKAYTGSQAQCLLTVLARGVLVQQLDGTMINWPITINLKQGVRTVTFTPGSVSGAQLSGDNFPVMNYGWFPGVLTPYLETNISGDAPSTWPTVTIEISTDQFE